MIAFQNLTAAGAAVAVMSAVCDGDCGWAGAVTGTRDAFLRQVGAPPGALYALRQVHGSGIRVVDGNSPGQGVQSSEQALGDGDGLITNSPGIPLGVTVADCVPVLLYDPVTRAIAALHAGREGTMAGIASKGVAQLVSTFGVCPADIRGVIGPSAGPCCYEVSTEIRSRCVSRGVVADGSCLDLWASNHNQLVCRGVKSAHIEVAGCCTICSDRFFSYRRQSTSQRNMAVIMT